MSKKTTYHSLGNRLTGKTVTQRGSSNGSVKTTHYKAEGSGLARAVFGPTWRPKSITKRDREGNTRTKKF